MAAYRRIYVFGHQFQDRDQLRNPTLVSCMELITFTFRIEIDKSVPIWEQSLMEQHCELQTELNAGKP